MLLRRVIVHVRAQDWTAVAIDFAIVVLGILLAMQITEWNQARHDRVRERAYLGRIAADLEQSFQDIEDSIALAQEREALGRLLVDSVDDEAPVRADPGRYFSALAKSGYTYSPAIRSHAFDELRSSGELGLVADKTLAVRARMLARPDFIEWLPAVGDRGDDILIYRKWLREAQALRERIVAHPTLAGEVP